MIRWVKAACWSLALLFVTACTSTATAQEGERQEVFAKSFEDQEQRWVLRYIVYPSHTQTFLQGGRAWTAKVNLSLLQKTPLAPEGKEVPEKTEMMWRFTSGNSAATSQEKAKPIGDAYVDAGARRVYVVLARGSYFRVNIMDLDATFPELPAKLEIFAVSDDDPKLSKTRENIIVGPDELRANPIEIDAIKIDKAEGSLIVSIGEGEEPRQNWSVSLKDRVWHRILPPPEAETK